MDLNRLSTCTFPLKDRPLAEALPVIAAAGYQRIDLLGRMPHFSLDPAECNPEALKTLVADYGLTVANLGTYVGVGLASADESEQEAALQEVKLAIDVAAYLGARSIRVFRPNAELSWQAVTDPVTR